MIFGEKIKALRVQKGLEQKDLATLTGLAQGQISMIERSSAIPSLQKANILANAFDVELASLLSDESIEDMQWKRTVTRLQYLKPAERKIIQDLVNLFVN